MKLVTRYSRLTAFFRYRDCCERLEDEQGCPLAWWAELALVSLFPFLMLLALSVELLGSRLKR